MSTLQSLRKRLAKADTTVIARLAGLDRGTVRRIAAGSHDPNMATFDRIEAALAGKVSPPKRLKEVA